MRGLGVLGLNICYLIWTWSKSDADRKRYLPFMTVMYFTFPAALPWYAQKNLPSSRSTGSPPWDVLPSSLGTFTTTTR